MAEQVDGLPYNTTTPNVIQHPIQSNYMVNPSFYLAYNQSAVEETLKFTLKELINIFKLSSKPPKAHQAALKNRMESIPSSGKFNVYFDFTALTVISQGPQVWCKEKSSNRET